MKIIIVNDYARIVGGAAKIAIMSARALSDRGHDVEFFAGSGPIGPELLSCPSVKVTCLDDTAHNRDPNRLRGAIRGLWYGRAAKELREILRKCDPKNTVVHLHAYRDTLTGSVANAAIRMGFVTVYTAHEYTLGCPYGGFFDYRQNSICRLTGLSADCLKSKCNLGGYSKKLWYFAAQFVFSRLARIPKRLSHVIFISKLNKRVLTPYLPPTMRTSIISNPSDFMAAPPAPIEASSPFLFIGSLEPHKDPLTAARAARILDVPITFVGSGSIEDQVRQENPKAALTGWLGREDVEQKLQESRSLIFPSIWYEAQPLTTMEASARGLPLIVSDCSSAVEQVEQLGVGEIFRGGDTDELVEKMRPYLDVEFARKQGRATQAAYRKLDLSTDLHVTSLVALYESELHRLLAAI